MPLPLDAISLTVGLAAGTSLPPEHEASLGVEFVAAVDGLIAKHRHLPIAVLSAFSTRTEICAVEAALERGWPVAACLACAPDELIRRFEPDFRERVRNALAASANTTLVSEVAAPIAALRAAGEYIATYSHVLVSFKTLLPAGANERGVSSTDDVVVRESGVTLEQTGFDALGIPELGPRYDVTIGAKPSEADAAAAKVFPERFTGDRLFEIDFAEALERLELFNTDLALSRDAAHPVVTLDDLMQQSDTIALKLQNTTYRFLYVLYVIAIIATAVQYANWPALSYVMVALAFVAYRIAKRFDYENRYQDYRALSEGLRVQRAWFQAGIVGNRVDDAYLGMQQRELMWIRMALRYVHLATRDAAEHMADDAGCRGWVDEQWKYFKNKPKALQASLGRLNRNSRMLFWLATIVSTALIAYLDLPTAPQHLAAFLSGRVEAHATGPLPAASAMSIAGWATNVQDAWNRSWLFNADWIRAIHRWDVGDPPTLPSAHHTLLERLSTALLTLYAAIALLLANYSEKRGYAVNVKRYDRMFVVFDRARRRIAEIAEVRDPAGQELVRELGRAALIENADWLLVRRERPLELVNPR